MRVLQIANGYIEQGLYRNLFAALEAKGIENQVYVPVNYTRNEPFDFGPEVYIDRCFSNLDRIFYYTKQRKMIAHIQRNWDVSQFHVLHAHTVFSGGFTAWKLSRKYGIPYVVAVRNTDKNVFFRYMRHLRHEGVRVLRDAAAVVFLSPAYRDSVIERYVPSALQNGIYSKSVVLPNGISDVFIGDVQKPHPLDEQCVRLLYVGEISDNKNIATTIEAIEQLRTTGLHVQFTVVGPIRQEKYRGYFDTYPYITYLGKLPPDQVKNIMGQSDIFVMPSHEETFGLVYAEAMSQGLPVLYTKGQGFDGHFADGTVGYAVDDHSPTDVAQKIKLTVEHYDTLAQKAYEEVARFSWDKISDAYYALYCQMTAARN